MAVAPPRILVLTVLGIETGMRTGEMTNLRWEDIDFLNNALRVVKSKSMAGIRAVPLSVFAKAELLQWRSLVGPEFSDWVVLPYLLLEARVRFACDGGGRLSNYDRSVARAYNDAGGSALFGDSG